MKLTDDRIISALSLGIGVRCEGMPKYVYLKCKNGKELYIEDWGMEKEAFMPYLKALEDDTWELVDVGDFIQ